MATKAKDNTLRKDKKVTSSSNSQTRQGNSAKQVTSGFTAKEKPNPSAKPTPNYLRPTLSSRPEPLVKPQIKKPGNEDPANAQKAQLLRRRSFDRPPSASRMQQPFTSPDPNRPGSRDKTSVQSSSYSSPKITSPKPVLERNSKSFKPVKSKPTPPASGTMTRTSSFDKNNDRSRATSVTRVPSSPETETLVLETSKQESNEETSVPEPEVMVNVESEAQSVLSETEEESKKHPDDVNCDELNNAEDEKLQNSDNCNVWEGQTLSPAVETEETENELQVESGENQNKAEENQRNMGEINNLVDHPEASVAVEDDHDKQEENEKENADASTAELYEEKKAEDVIRVDERTKEETKTITEEEHKSKEAQNVVEESVEERKPAEAASSAPKLQGGQGKKESPAAYNDVIEETKNKLMEKRKNKVKALVGAFETVIDYETAASK